MLSTPTLDLPLRGRARELARIAAVLEATLRGGTALILVEAPPGHGKTRLLRAAMALGEQLGYALAGPGGLPCPPPRRSAGPQAPGPLPGPGGAAPAGRTGHPGGDPVLVVLDGLQGPDPAAGPGAGILPRHGLPHDRVVWLAARRTDTGHDPRGVLLSDPRRRHEHLVLGPLGDDAALRLAADLLGAPPGPSVARLVEQTGGHPWLLTELLAGMREEGTLRVEGGRARLTGTRLPDRVRTRLHTTLAQYSRECRQFLNVAAVLGTEVEYTELSAMLGRPLSALLPVMEEACATGVVRHAADRLAFHSGFMRQAVRDAVPDALKRVLHQEAALLRASAGARPGAPFRAGVRIPDGGAAPPPATAVRRLSGAGAGPGPGPGPAPGPGPWDGCPPGGHWPFSAAGRAARGGGPDRPPVPPGTVAPEGFREAGAEPPRYGAPGPRLNRRQRELVLLVSEGLTNRQAATRLGLSPHTVNYHLRRLFKSYGVNSRIDLLRAVAEHHRAPAGAPAAPGAGPDDSPLAPTLLAPLAPRPAAAPATAAPVSPSALSGAGSSAPRG
ncbi:LuxR family transcriptional regulator [Streptomyces sp. SID8352]|uniref:helix-turn-helix transcriptional regulator n=1 Tax=Streptomyces sp. SID8352 TaxID=2690338 RepID=UPI001F01B099|nr:LuxR family transcriptional regulator [Streptomyces sp. SID8352]